LGQGEVCFRLVPLVVSDVVKDSKSVLSPRNGSIGFLPYATKYLSLTIFTRPHENGENVYIG